MSNNTINAINRALTVRTEGNRKAILFYLAIGKWWPGAIRPADEILVRRAEELAESVDFALPYQADMAEIRRVREATSVHTCWYGNGLERLVTSASGRPCDAADIVTSVITDWPAGQRARMWRRAVVANAFYDVYGPFVESPLFDPYNQLYKDTCDIVWAPIRAWQGRTACSIARKMYEEDDFDCMPVLGDALEDAGCTDPAILEHCRKSEKHTRGCWIVDLLLGKE